MATHQSQSSASSWSSSMTAKGCHEKEKQQPSLIQRVKEMESVIKLLLETLTDLSDSEFENFKRCLLGQIDFDRPHSNIPQRQLMMTDLQDLVFLMVQINGQQSAEMIKEDLKYMRKNELVHRLSYSISSPKRKRFDEHRQVLIWKVAIMAAVRELLLETLNDLSNKELQEFKQILQSFVSQKDLPDISSMLSCTADQAETVDVMVEMYGHQSVELTWQALKKMKRTDLMQRLSKPSLRHEHQPAQSERVTDAAVKRFLVEKLKDLSNKKLEKFKLLLRFTYFKKGLTPVTWSKLDWADSADRLVELMVKTCGQQAVEVTKEVLMDMNQTDLVKRMEEASLEPKEKHRPKPIEKEVAMRIEDKLLAVLKPLTYWELKQLRIRLEDSKMMKGLPTTSRLMLETVDRNEIVDLIMEIYGQQSVAMTRMFLKNIQRRKLKQKLSGFSSASKEGASRSLQLECGSSTQDSSVWTKLEPEVHTADESPIYSLQSEAGTFECSISGLRWVCKEKVSLKYQFCSLKDYMERIEHIQYMPAGPLMNITVTAGTLDEVYLPHWICIVDNPTILDKFAVLHIDDCGDFVEKVSEVTLSHVKLSEPVFSLKMILVKIGLPVEINCSVLIYKTNTAFLTLHVYLIPRDPGLQQEMDQREISRGYKAIRKPHPEKSLKMKNRFVLTADLDTAEINPDKVMLRCTDPNFYEVFIENADINFKLHLTHENEQQPLWTCAIRRDEYQNTDGHTAGEAFIDRHRAQLIDRVNDVPSILDALLQEKVIQKAIYDEILTIPTTRDKMRRLYSGPLNAAGDHGKKIFYNILKEKDPILVADLQKKK